MSVVERNSMATPPGETQPADDRTVHLVFQPNGRQGDVPAGMMLLEAARSLGVEIESICGGRQT
ncbi:MAG TPA: hypothetical protein VNK95_08330, partial [Caldilineaceae bacterium]|nr:hypothetical protein [Caldilineaceae bacterium]